MLVSSEFDFLDCLQVSLRKKLERILSSSNGELNLSAEDTTLLFGCSTELNQIFAYQRRIQFL